MPLTKSSSKAAFSRNVAEMMDAGHPQKQALAAAYATQREAKGRAFGGVAPMMSQASQSMPAGVAGGMAGMPPPALPSGLAVPQGSPGLAGGRGFARGGVANPAPKTFDGPIVSNVPGRTDKHFTHVPSGSFVIPADIVSAHGEGNTLAGMTTLHKLFKLDQKHGTAHKLSTGGKATDRNINKPVPVKLAGGEIVVPPENVHETMQRVTKKKLTLDQAHAAMDAWVVSERKKLRKTLAKLPGPAKD